jgi:phage terminase small subunit
MQSASKTVAPPQHVPLEAQDMPFWESVVAEFAKAHWTEHQLELAAMLARTMSNLESIQRDLRSGGFTSKTDKGTPVSNPLVTVAKGMTNDILALRRSLALHARGKTGDNRHAGNQKQQGKDVENRTKQLEDEDDLIARPS